MVKMYVRHTVADFAKWKPAFNEHETVRKKFGAKKSEVFVNAQNPNETLVIIEWENKEQAKNFNEKSDLKEVMKRGGVIGTPEINFAE